MAEIAAPLTRRLTMPVAMKTPPVMGSGSSGPSPRAVAYRLAIAGDSFGERSQNVTSSPSRAFSGYATGTVSGVSAGSLIIDGWTYAVSGGQSAASITAGINADPAATVIAYNPSGSILSLYAKNRNASFTVTAAPAGLGITTGTYTPEVSSQVNAVVFRWADDRTVDVGNVGWGIGAWLQAISRGKYKLPYQANRAVGGSNSGQWNRFVTDDDRLKQLYATISEEIAAGRPVDAVLFHLGTNDLAASYTLGQMQSNYTAIFQKVRELGIPVITHTILPRGNGTYPTYRIDGTGSFTGGSDKRTLAADFNAWLVGTLPSTVPGVYVVDGFSAFSVDGTSWDVAAGLTYDGLHLSTNGCRVLATLLKAKADEALASAVSSPLPTDAAEATNFLGSVGLMAGTSGSVQVTGNGTTNAGFTFNGKNSGTTADSAVPTGWTVATVTGWAGTDPTNVKGTVTATKPAADAGDAIQLVVACNSSGKANTNTVSLEARATVTLPVGLADGEYFEAVCKVEIESPAGFRGADLELRVTEPDATVRTVRSLQPPPNGTAEREWDSAVNFTGAGALILTTPPRIKKAGTYGTITLAVMLHFAGQAASLAGTYRISQVAVRKAVFA